MAQSDSCERPAEAGRCTAKQHLLLVAATTTVVAVALAVVAMVHAGIVVADQGSAARAESAADQGAFTAARKCANTRTTCATDQGTFSGADTVMLIRILSHSSRNCRDSGRHKQCR